DYYCSSYTSTTTWLF
nr:immunoglobulin light chain junction region [Macaca mulatta]MOV72329.1 immunoglobulin light chain junction region [Macaca mulatta]MOV72386.1 immunoglobulin light chain junction region [Macaca mulatta]MOV72399.1 immunoglobulin light chain junction region [Macaca mulatta]MOV72505.1 immunoglobulin light chain junction region [Macaca mulatta]